MNRFRDFGYEVSRNHTRTAWVLKCDIRKFFANIDHKILKNILAESIGNEGTLRLLAQVIGSFSSNGNLGVGLPLGNLTSQLLVNVYMNKFDHFIKRELKVRFYIRYADDFVLLSADRLELEIIQRKIVNFLTWELKLSLHPDKVCIKAFASGIDFLGWVHFSDRRVIRTTTKRRMYRKMVTHRKDGTYQSYSGLLRHGNSKKVARELMKLAEYVDEN